MMSDAAFPLPGLLQMGLGLYGYLLPLLLYTLWTTLSLWDLSRRQGLSTACLWGWCGAIYLLPGVGALAYLVAGKGELPANLKMTAVLGGIVLLAAVLVVGHFAGGIA
jgi:hypothetical protein